jgi:hypothetical protein
MTFGCDGALLKKRSHDAEKRDTIRAIDDERVSAQKKLCAIPRQCRASYFFLAMLSDAE